MGQGEINHSIWLIPEQSARERFAAVMAELAARHGGPAFGPHVTLLGGMSAKMGRERMMGLVQSLAEEIGRVRFAPTGFGHTDALYRAVYVEAAGSKALIKAHDAAAHVLFNLRGRFEGKKYLPHVSLLYGEMGQAEREAIVAGLDSALLAPFECDSIELWSTSGMVSQWHRVGAARL